MLDQLLRWISAGDTALTAMGPIVSTVVAMLGGAGITQLLKFPLVEIVPDRWERWSVRLVAIVATWALMHFMAQLPNGLELVFAVVQPYAYSGVMAVVRHRWPWLEATRAAGSVRPSKDAQAALAERRAP